MHFPLFFKIFFLTFFLNPLAFGCCFEGINGIEVNNYTSFSFIIGIDVASQSTPMHIYTREGCITKTPERVKTHWITVDPFKENIKQSWNTKKSNLQIGKPGTKLYIKVRGLSSKQTPTENQDEDPLTSIYQWIYNFEKDSFWNNLKEIFENNGNVIEEVWDFPTHGNDKISVKLRLRKGSNDHEEASETGNTLVINLNMVEDR